MTKIPSFPKIFHIGAPQIPHLFDGFVEVTEKIDGSQFGFGITSEGEIVWRSKNIEMTDSPTPTLFHGAVDQVERLRSILVSYNTDVFIYCEHLESPHHNTLTYERIPKNHLYLFGMMYAGKFVHQHKILKEMAEALDLEPPNVLYSGPVSSIDQLEDLLNRTSILGGPKIEGIVVKNYHYGVQITPNVILPITMGKYVREDFKEKNNKDWKKNKSTKGKLEIFIENFRTEARWQKAVQHLCERGELEQDPRDIGKLFKEVAQDLLDEESDTIKQGLFEIFKDEILRKARAGLAEWYKEQLLKSSIKES